MPQCPKCKAPYEVGQRYCEQCDSYLLHPEEGDYLCPQCGIRVSSNQEICHKCNAKLSKDTAAPNQAPETPASPTSEPPPAPAIPPKTGLPPWALGALIGAAFVIIILLGLLIRQGAAPTKEAEKPATEAAPSSAAATPVTPGPERPAAPTPEASLADGVRKTLSTLREAQLKNDIILFMSCYSYLYSSLDRKRQKTLADWKDFDFLDMNFILDEVKPMGPDNAMARVTWTMQVQNRKSRQFDSFTQVYQVILAKELGKWRIRTINDLTDEESGKE